MLSTPPDKGSPFPNFDRANVFMFDPDRPHETANELAARMGGKLTDPNAMNHNCGYCHKTLSWDLFTRHAKYCYTKWRKVTLNTRHRIFKGATPYLPHATLIGSTAGVPDEPPGLQGKLRP